MKVTSIVASAILLAQQANAFSITPVGPSTSQLRASDFEDSEVDYDAPNSRAVAVGNVVKTPEVKVGFGPLQVPVPSFIARSFGLRADASGDMDEVFMVDEECYLGKEGNLDDCADFDPKFTP